MEGPATYDTAGVGDENVAGSLAAVPAPPDLVVVGHTHREMRDSVVGGVHFVQPGPFGASVSVVHLDLEREDAGWRVRRVRAEPVSARGTAASPRLARRLGPARDSVRAWARTPIGLALGPMRAGTARAEPDAILGFVHDVQRRRTGAELSAASVADLAAGFDADTIRVAHVLALYPFDHTLRAVRLSGARLKAYLEWSARYFQVDPVGRIALNDTVPGADDDVVAGAQYDIDLRRPVGDRIQHLRVRGPAGAAGRQLHDGGEQRPPDRRGRLRHAARRAGGVRQGRAPVRAPDRRRAGAQPDRPGGVRRLASWRIVPEAADRAVRDLFGAPRRPLPAGARDTVLLRVLAIADLHGHLERAPVLKRRWTAWSAPAGAPRSGSTRATRFRGPCSPTPRPAGPPWTSSTTSAGRGRGGGPRPGLVGRHLRRRMAESRYPWLAANVADSASGRRPGWAVPWRVLEAGGLRVGVVGYITSETKAIVRADRRPGSGSTTVARAPRAAAAARSEHPDVTILLAHAGAACDGAVCSGEIIRVAESLDRGVDLIVAGHTHRVVETAGGVPIVEAGGNGGAIAVADLVGRRREGGSSGPGCWSRPMPGRATPAWRALVEDYRERVDSVASRVVARAQVSARPGAASPARRA